MIPMAGNQSLEGKPPTHNHDTKGIRRYGQCPACDEYRQTRQWIPVPPAALPSEGGGTGRPQVIPAEAINAAQKAYIALRADEDYKDPQEYAEAMLESAAPYMQERIEVIPFAAAEAAAKAAFTLHHDARLWGAFINHDEARHLTRARAALEAAAPYISAQTWDRAASVIPRLQVEAWDEGYQSGVRDEHLGWTTNPYRSQA